MSSETLTAASNVTGDASDRTTGPPRYDAFLSYSHGADEKLAPRLQTALQRLAKPWNQRRALHVFRDKTNLSASPALWPTIEANLAASRFFILLASPEAARSAWVSKEVAWWLANRSIETLFIVLTSGRIVWEEAVGDFDWSLTDALPSELNGAFRSEPHWIDLRWARHEMGISPSDPRLQDAAATLSAPIRGRDKNDLIGEDMRQHRRAKWLARSAITGLIVLTIASVVAGGFAWTQWGEAIMQRQTAVSRQLAAQARNRFADRLDIGLLLPIEAFRARDTIEARGSMLAALDFEPRLTAYLNEPDGGVGALAFRPDGRVLASAIDGKDIIFWDLDARRSVDKPLPGNGDAFFSLAFSPDGKLLASGSRFKQSLQLWNAETHELIATLADRPDGAVGTLAFSPDGTLLVAGIGTGDVTFWDVAKRQPSGPPVKNGRLPIQSVAFRPDGTIVAAGDQDGKVTLWDVQGRSIAGTLKPERESQVEAVAFSPDGTILASAGTSSTVTLWDVESRQPLGPPLTGHTDSVKVLAYSPDGRYVASGSIDSTIMLWDVATRQRHGAPLAAHSAWITDLAFGPDSRTLISAGADGRILVWDIAATSGVVEMLAGRSGRVWSLAVSPDGSLIASGNCRRQEPGVLCVDGDVRLWDAGTGAPRDQPFADGMGLVRALAFGATGSTLVGASCGSTQRQECFGVDVRTYDVATGSLKASTVIHPTDQVEAVTLSADGKRLGAAVCVPGRSGGNCRNQEIRVWDTATGEPVGPPLTGLGDRLVTDLRFSPDGRVLVASQFFDAASAWDVVTGQVVVAPMKGGNAVFSPDDRILALVASPLTDRNDIVLVDVQTGAVQSTTRTSYRPTVTEAAFSADRRTLALGGVDGKSRDGSIFLWDAESRQALRDPFVTHRGPIVSLAFSPDGRWLIAGGDDGTVRRLDLAPDVLQARACRIANRNLTHQEWSLYLGAEPYRKTCPDLPEPDV